MSLAPKCEVLRVGVFDHLVGSSDNVMIGGIIITGTDPVKVVARATGPSLGNSGVAGALQDPTLEVHDANGNVQATIIGATLSRTSLSLINWPRPMTGSRRSRPLSSRAPTRRSSRQERYARCRADRVLSAAVGSDHGQSVRLCPEDAARAGFAGNDALAPLRRVGRIVEGDASDRDLQVTLDLLLHRA